MSVTVAICRVPAVAYSLLECLPHVVRTTVNNFKAQVTLQIHKHQLKALQSFSPREAETSLERSDEEHIQPGPYIDGQDAVAAALSWRWGSALAVGEGFAQVHVYRT